MNSNMDEAMNTTQKLCRYCEKPCTKVKKGEHVIAFVLGGSVSLKDVCTKCNTGILQWLDDQFITNSWMNLIRSEAQSKGMLHCWYKEEQTKMLLEACPIWEAGDLDLPVYPQIILFEGVPVIRLSVAESLPAEREKALLSRFKDACRQCKEGVRNAIIPERIKQHEIYEDCVYPTKLFLRQRIDSFTDKSTVFIGFVHEEEKEKLIDLVSRMPDRDQINRDKIIVSNQILVTGVEQYPEVLTRAFLKYAINLLAYICKQTPVNYSTFKDPIDFIRNGIAIRNYTRRAGYVYYEDLLGHEGPENEHKIWVQHNRGVWGVLTSYFGGKLSTGIALVGPNLEGWNKAIITTPLRYDGYKAEKDWIIQTENLHFPSQVRMGWFELNKFTRAIQLDKMTHMRKEKSRSQLPQFSG